MRIIILPLLAYHLHMSQHTVVYLDKQKLSHSQHHYGRQPAKRKGIQFEQQLQI